MSLGQEPHRSTEDSLPAEGPGRGAVTGRRFRQLLLQLPFELLQEPGSLLPLSRLLTRFEAELPGSRATLRVPGLQFARPRRERVLRCQDQPGCAWHREAGPLNTARHCDLCQRLSCRLAGGGTLWLETAVPASARLCQQLSEVGAVLSAAVEHLHQQRRQRHEAAPANGALARELHDSVAQQLGYLSFQASCLQQQLALSGAAEITLKELRSGLSQLQRQVRELITSARLTMDGRSLRQALVDSVDEFSRRCSIVFELDNRLPDASLVPEVELQILQIIREALANVVRHAHARHVRIELLHERGQRLRASVSDDGIGMAPASPEDNHYGLSIMHERARAIGAQLTITATQPHGTRVNLSVPLVDSPLEQRP